MNIHEYQAKDLLREYGVPVSNGVIIFSLDEINEKTKQFLQTNLYNIILSIIFKQLII